MEKVDFSQPIRQSSKGIIIIFAFNVIKFFKNFFALFIALAFGLVRKKSFLSLTPMNIILIILGIFIIIFIIAVLKYLHFKFHLSETDFHLSTGVINKDNKTIPKSKIQNVYIKQNFVQQLINVVSLKIETAGDKKSEIEISALDKSTALLLKKELFNRINVDSENLEVSENTNVFFKASIKRLLLEGILHNHLKSFAIIASFVLGLYYEFKDYIENLEFDMDIDGYAEYEGDTMIKFLYIYVLIIFLGLLISMLFSVVRIFIANFNLEVIENQKTLEINKGLFNKVSLSLTPSKIQNIVVKTNRLKRYFNLYSLDVKQAMANKKLSKNLGIIALDKYQINHLLNKLLSDYQIEDEVLKPETYYRRILILKSLLPIFIINSVAFLIFDVTALWLNLILVPIVILFVRLRYKKAHYNVSERFVTVGSGAVDTITNILEINKIQAVELSQSLFQKRKEIASVVIYTASKSVTIPYVKEKDAKSIYDFLLFRVESQGGDWM